MKTISLKLIFLGLIVSATLLSGCGHAESEDPDNNEGNHANTPKSEPGTEYPGSAGDSAHIIQDTIHVNP